MQLHTLFSVRWSNNNQVDPVSTPPTPKRRINWIFYITDVIA